MRNWIWAFSLNRNHGGDSFFDFRTFLDLPLDPFQSLRFQRAVLEWRCHMFSSHTSIDHRLVSFAPRGGSNNDYANLYYLETIYLECLGSLSFDLLEPVNRFAHRLKRSGGCTFPLRFHPELILLIRLFKTYLLVLETLPAVNFFAVVSFTRLVLRYQS